MAPATSFSSSALEKDGGTMSQEILQDLGGHGNS
jgi:hypothetical protein